MGVMAGETQRKSIMPASRPTWNEQIYTPGILKLLPLTEFLGGARGVVVIVVGNGHGDMSSNPGRDWLHFT